MIKLIDNAINRITMYRLVLYYLIFLLSAGIVLSAVGILPYDPFALLFMIGFAVAVSAITNAIFARVFNVPANVESVYISALILALIITPLTSLNDLWFIGWASVLAMSSKYIVAFNKKHLFNPVAFAVVVTALTIDQTASWWVATGAMLPFVLIGGLLVVRRIRRFGLVLSFLAAAFGTTTVFTLINHGDLLSALQFMLMLAPTIFFGFIFVTEPLTTPPTRRLQIIYGVLVGLLFAPEVHFGSFYFTPELALLVGNLFSFLVSPKTKLILTLKQRLRLSADVYEFVFMPSRQLAFAPGQYMEWTLGHDDPDSRGNRRYFTLASAPTERELRVGVKFYSEPSSYKESLLMMEPDDAIVAGQLAGDFTLPDDASQPLVFIAGGIGVTPFRSMIKYLLDTRQRRPITLFYSNKSVNDIVYQDVFDLAERKLGIKTVYTITDVRDCPASWRGSVGRVDAAMIRSQVPNYRKALYYVSGPVAMVEGTRDLLQQIGIHGDHIKTDLFSGLA